MVVDFFEASAYNNSNRTPPHLSALRDVTQGETFFMSQEIALISVPNWCLRNAILYNFLDVTGENKGSEAALFRGCYRD